MDNTYNRITNKLKNLKPITVFPPSRSGKPFNDFRLFYSGENSLRMYLHEIGHLLEPNRFEDRIWIHGSIQLYKRQKEIKVYKRECRCVQIENLIRKKILKLETVKRISFIDKKYQDPKRTNLSYRVLKKRLNTRKDILIRTEKFDKDSYDPFNLPYPLRSLNNPKFPNLLNLHTEFMGKVIKDLIEMRLPHENTYDTNRLPEDSLGEFARYVWESYSLRATVSPTRFKIQFNFNDYI